MGIVEAIILGIIQGLTEWLPISSTAHLRIVPALMHWDDPGSAFTAVIQLGTTLAVLIYFRNDLWNAIIAWARSIGKSGPKSAEAKLGWAVFWGSIPIVVLGLALKSKIENEARSLWVIAFSLVAMGVVMILAEKLAKHTRKVEDIDVKDGIAVGFWQACALIPGMSRSGSSISGALFQGLDREAAARFSFLFSVPSVLGAGLYELVKARKEILGPQLTPTLVATAVSFVVGYASIAWLIKYLQKRGIGVFVWYRFALAAVLVVLLLGKWIAPDAGAEIKIPVNEQSLQMPPHQS